MLFKIEWRDVFHGTHLSLLKNFNIFYLEQYLYKSNILIISFIFLPSIKGVEHFINLQENIYLNKTLLFLSIKNKQFINS